MKQLKVTFLFFCIFSLFLFSSCNNKGDFKTSENLTLDSVNFYIQKMRDKNFSDTTCLKYANKALQNIKNINHNSKDIEILGYKIYLLGNLKQYDSAIYTSKELLQKSINKNDSVSIARAYFNMAYYYNKNKQKDSAYYFYNLTKNIHLTFNDSTTVGRILLDMAIIQSNFGDYNGSDYSATQALKYLNNNKQYSVSIYNCLAISSRKQKDYKEALYWYDKAINISTERTNKIKLLNHKANTLRYLKEYDKSITLLNSLIKDSTLNNNPKTKARIIDNLAYTKWLANNRTNILPELLKALTIRQKENDLSGLNASYAHLSEYYKKENPEIALSYASKMYKIATIQNSPQDRLEALQKLIELDNSTKTKEYYTVYVRLNDSLRETEQVAKNKFAKIKYDSEKNREENLELKIVTSKKELELEKEKTKNIITAVTGGSIVLGLLILGYFHKQKHKQEKLQEIYKTETRIAKKVHDEVANNVVNIMNKVQYTDNPKSQLLDDLEKVYLLTRNISHENNPIETGKNFEVYLKTMLKSFNNNKTTIIIKDIHQIGLSVMTKEKQVEIYRILQELMVNMRKHSKASLVAISFKSNKKNCYINYSDNGIGLDIEKLTLKNGLKNVETRIKSINGTITFKTAINKGFKAFISFKR